MARPMPTSLGRLREPPLSGTNPAGTATSPKRARSDASRMSQSVVISSPTPTAGPFTAAMVGWGRSSSLRMALCSTRCRRSFRKCSASSL